MFAWLVNLLVLLTKVFMFIILIIMLRWTIPRFRFDQLMDLAWKIMIPLSLLNVVMVMFCLQYEMNRLWLLAGSLVLFVAWGAVGGSQRRSSLQSRTKKPAVSSSSAVGHAVGGHH